MVSRVRFQHVRNFRAEDSRQFLLPRCFIVGRYSRDDSGIKDKDIVIRKGGLKQVWIGKYCSIAFYRQKTSNVFPARWSYVIFFTARRILPVIF